MVGTRSDIQTALLAKTLVNQMQYQQFILVRTAILQSMGLNGATGVPLSVGALYVDPNQKFHLSARGAVSTISNRSSFTLQAVNATPDGVINGNPPATPEVTVVIVP